MFFKELVNVYKSHENRNTRFPLLLFLCTEQFTYTTLFTFLQDRAAILLNMKNVHSLYCLLLYLFASLCPHTVF